jgi:ABC-type glycerol-3-phosphate transport system substrate-binding protein
MKTQMRALALIGAVAVIAGCGGGSSSSYETPPVATQPASFTSWSKQEVFAKAETATPTETEPLMFNFDGDDNPDAYAELLPTAP